MRAFELSGDFGLRNLSIKERKELPLKPDEVRIKVYACSLNYRDLLVINGIYNKNQKLPLIPISDGAGRVIEVGMAVKNFKVGDRVCATFAQNWPYGPPKKSSHLSTLGSPLDGMLCETVVLNEEGVVLIPEHLSYEEAATLPCAAVTAFSALTVESQIKPGQTVLFLGTGGVSIFGLQLALLMGAETIITSKDDNKLKKAKELGAHHTINYLNNPEWSKEVRKITNNEGVDVVLEVGGMGTIEESIKSTKMGGQINLIGVLSEAKKPINLTSILMNHQRLQGIFVGSKQVFLALNRSLSLSKLTPVIDSVFSFENSIKALEKMSTGGHFGKICISLK